ncbi:5'-methylthioadenosine/adenosylhomocysteine nucleosidase [Thermosediminibacter oceani]|uniref:adenosylhomocysteine nucleosidase n=1 Tax=Thermosediminibacter oceani (strain ATCC BAA-1034 / DSM 16646 / JW/IW-1228P) TaxID=555079 RepID=D9S2Z6_THEOJ|nr:5'-methylthioadenosine/adenosylhomocysteine nucleosidase [Thermosediminibacter oceani]ADL07773.1 methylthioadenosine nucleosidase [Thermosediminibacter oceani DSM 16646]
MFIIGIIGAVDREIALFCEELKDKKTITKASLTFFTGTLEGRDAVVVKCGVGKVNAAICTQVMIDYFAPSAIICTGVAGALREDLDIGDIVISRDVVQHDVDGTAFGHELGEIPNLGIKAFTADETLVQIAQEVARKQVKGRRAITGRILSGDQFISSKEKVKFLRSFFDGACVEMEGGAIGQVCYLNKVPFLIIRSISDRADGKAVSVYETFADEAARNSSHIVLGIIKLYEGA